MMKVLKMNTKELKNEFKKK